MGTGSGCIAVCLAVKCPAAQLWAVDVSPSALQVAAQNASRHGVADRIRLVESDGFARLHSNDTAFDLIISNPPYIPTAEIGTLDPEVRDYDPRQALDGGADGLDHFRRLAAEAPPFLKPHGRCMLEFGDGQADALAAIFKNQNWIVEAICQDYTQRPRFLIAKR